MKIPPSQVLEKQKLSVTRKCWVLGGLVGFRNKIWWGLGIKWGLTYTSFIFSSNQPILSD